MISVLFPTIRPANFAACYAAWQRVRCPVPFELVVVADFPCPEGVTVGYWEQRKRGGTVDAINRAYQWANGPYVFITNDQATPQPDMLAHLYQAAIRWPTHLLTPVHEPRYPFFYYGQFFAAFPFASKQVIEGIQGGPWIFDPLYGSFYADPDLSLKAHQLGVTITEVGAARHRHDNRHDAAHEANVSASLEKDRAIFRARWDHLGEFKDP